MNGQLVLVPPDILEPIDQSDQVNRIPGVDAPCPRGLGRDCEWFCCTCYCPSEDDEPQTPP